MAVADAEKPASPRPALRALHRHDSAARCADGSADDLGTFGARRMSTKTVNSPTGRNGHGQARCQICLLHPFDPRGTKVGGLETYIRDFITFHPEDADVLMIGVDSTGSMALGEIHQIE